MIVVTANVGLLPFEIGKTRNLYHRQEGVTFSGKRQSATPCVSFACGSTCAEIVDGIGANVDSSGNHRQRWRDPVKRARSGPELCQQSLNGSRLTMEGISTLKAKTRVRVPYALPL